MLAATFDIGTTAVKAVAVRDDGEPVLQEPGGSIPWKIMDIKEPGSRKNGDSAFCALSHSLLKKIPGKMRISLPIFSGQMQDVIPVGSDRKALGNAILYSDWTSGIQTERIEKTVERDTITAITGNHF